MTKPKQRMRKLEAISDIDREIGLLKEIKDIQDELRMIMRIFNDQDIVRTEFTDIMERYCQGVEPRIPQSPTTPGPMQEPKVLIGAKSKSHKVRPMTITKDGGFAEGGHQEWFSEPCSNIRDFGKLLDDAAAVHDAVWKRFEHVIQR